MASPYQSASTLQSSLNPKENYDMKRPILILVLWLCLLCALRGQTSTQGQLVADIELKSTGGNGSTINNCQSVTFIFRSSYTGNINGIAFTATDTPLYIRAEHGSVLRSIPYTVTAGTLCIVEVH